MDVSDGRRDVDCQPELIGVQHCFDDFGAHNHDSIGYHYHVDTTTSTATSGSKTFTYTVRYLIKGAYAGAINSIPGCVVASQC